MVDLENYEQIYGDIGSSKAIASLLSYPQQAGQEAVVRLQSASFEGKKGVVGLIGAGNFTKMGLLPALKTNKADIKYIASMRGVSGTNLAKKYQIANSTTDYREILKDPEVDLIMITTRHDLHAEMVVEGLRAGKDVFVEKPLALNMDELNQVIEGYQKSGKTLTVGFNRRFSPHIQKMKRLLDAQAPKNLIATMNAGFIPEDSWVQDMEVGGGRIIGEACHYIDLLAFLSGSPVVAVCMNALGNTPAENTDNASILLKFENGDQGVIHYFSNGHKSYSKERVEAYSQGKTLILDNFRSLRGYGVKGFSSMKTRLDKGHKEQFKRLLDRQRSGGSPLIPFNSLVNTTRASLAAIESLKTGAWVSI
jgi:predicted dehydrogenase